VKNVLFGKKRYTAIDIGSHNITVADIKQEGNKQLRVLSVAQKSVPYDTLQNGIIKDTSVIANRLQEIFAETGIKPGTILTTVSNDSLVVRNVTLPRMNEKELSNVIRWEIEDYIPFSAEYARLDYKILSKEEDKMEILLIAVKEDVIRSFEEPFNILNLRPNVINIQPMALLSIVEYQGELEAPAAVLEIGAAGSRIVIGDKENVYLSRSFSTGGYEFTESIIETMGFNYENAEERKKDVGLQNEASNEGKEDDMEPIDIEDLGSSTGSSGTMLPMAYNIADELNRSLDFFARKKVEHGVNKIYITGGSSKLKGLKALLESEINQKIEILDPFNNFLTNFEIIEEDSPHYSIVLGLAASEVLADES
jgi:type IV pilus assembly protein PilM